MTDSKEMPWPAPAPTRKTPTQLSRTRRIITSLFMACVLGYTYFVFQEGIYDHALPSDLSDSLGHGHCGRHSPYGRFPKADDPFHFLPCTSKTVPPALDDTHHERTWARLFDRNPKHWSWGNTTSASSSKDPFAGRGIYLCGYLDVPLDYLNKSDERIVRLAVTKYQVSGLARVGRHSLPMTDALVRPGAKSERTIVIEPGGPGGSGTNYVWRAAETVTKRLSDNKYDVLGWDPRGVNITLPSISCFPYDADRDRWSLATHQYREALASPIAHLQFADAFNDATFHACKERLGDVPRFVTTAAVARDVEEIRKTLGEDELTAYMVSYGTGIGQTYTSMFPNSSGRIILDGTEYVRDHRLLGGFGWTALDNGTNAWHDGFLGECIAAGPERCALAQPKDGKEVTLPDLESRMEKLLTSLITYPRPAYSASTGPSVVTYAFLIEQLYRAMYNAESWPAAAQMLYELEAGNSTLAAGFFDLLWQFHPETKTECTTAPQLPATDELGLIVICGDAYDAPLPPGGDTLEFYDALWKNMTEQSWIAGNSRFYDFFPCKNYRKYWDAPGEVYRGDLNATLKRPVLLIAETYDPATPLRNGRRLLTEMGNNARLIAHHGYGHSSRDKSACTDSLAKAFILEGKVPEEAETACFADGKPYRYGVKEGSVRVQEDPLKVWTAHMEEVAAFRP